MNDPQSLGDTPPEEFRRQLHELADWIADFRQNIRSLPGAPNPEVAGPGAILAALPTEPPPEGERFEKILGDVNRVIVPGMVHWSHPMFLPLFRLDHDCSCNSRRNHHCAAQCKRNDVAHLPGRDRTRDGGGRLDPAMGAFTAGIWRGRV